VSILAALTATAALGFIAGRLSIRPSIRTRDADITRLHSQIATLQTRLRVAEYVAGHDRLTGLPNRSAAAEQFLAYQLRRRPTVVALVDLDRFKQTNDTYGHHVGDDLLRTVAERLASAAQRRGGMAARLTGDEFLLILPAGHTNPTTALADILATLAKPATLHTDDGEVTIRLTASAGIAIFDGDHGDFDTLLWHADIALYHAKQQRDTHRIYQPQMRMPRNAGRHGPRRRDAHRAHRSPGSSGEVIP
jgi:diguanylate cyclase (GGDEF)-like protein